LFLELSLCRYSVRELYLLVREIIEVEVKRCRNAPFDMFFFRNDASNRVCSVEESKFLGLFLDKRVKFMSFNEYSVIKGDGPGSTDQESVL
jgi:hypothetical protein